MIASPRVELFKHAINEIVNNVNNNYYGDTFLDPTGPGLLGKLIKKYNYTKYITLDMSSYFGLVQVIKDPKTNEIYFQSYLLYRFEQMAIQSKKHYINSWIERKIYYTDDEIKKLNSFYIH